MATVFSDVPEWPSEGSGEKLPESGRDARFDNAPPLEERVMQEFVEDITREGLAEKIDNVVASADRAPACDSEQIAGSYGDLIKIASAVEKAVNAAREKHNRPLLNAQRSLKGRADAVLAPMLTAVMDLRADLNSFMREQDRIARERRRLAEQEAEAARVAAEEERQRQIAANPAAKPELPPEPVITAAKVEAPVARGDYGSRVGTVTRWHHEIESVRKLPDRILKHGKVVEALNSVIAAEIRSAGKEKPPITGVRIWSEQEASVR